MVATVASRPRRVATPERWQKALARAIENGVQAFQVANSGAWVVTSKSSPGTVYETDGIECGCQAWLNGDPVCMHRAAYFAAMGMLELDQPEPTPPAPAVAALPIPYKCATCEDTGAIRKQNRIRPDLTFRAPCPVCRPAMPTTTFLATTPEGDQPSTPILGNCPECGGTGCHRAPGFFADCEACDGVGFVHPTRSGHHIWSAISAGIPVELPATMPTTRACRECMGTGTALDDHGKFTDCPDCHGVGIVPRAIAALDWTATPLAAD